MPAEREATVRVLVVEDNPGDARLIAEDLGEVGGFQVEAVDRLSLALERLAGGRLDVVLADLSLPDSRGFETQVKLRAQASLPLIVLTGIENGQLALRAVSEGAQDYLIKGRMNGPSIARCIRHGIERHRAVLTRLSPGGRLGKIVAFMGGNGGVGTTTLALNAAAELSQQGSRTVAIELRPDFGSFSCQLQHNPPRPLNRLLEQPADKLDVPELVPHLVDLPFKLQALFGPQRLEDFAEISAERAEAVLMPAARHGDWVVVDLPQGASAANRAAVRLCNFLALVLERDATSVPVARMTRDLLVLGYRGSPDGRCLGEPGAGRLVIVIVVSTRPTGLPGPGRHPPRRRSLQRFPEGRHPLRDQSSRSECIPDPVRYGAPALCPESRDSGDV